MPAPPKKDYSQVAPNVIQAYKEIRNVTKVARLFSMSPCTAKRILEDNQIQVGKSGVHNSKRAAGYPDESCYFCHKYSGGRGSVGYCLRHRRSVAGRNIEHCFEKE